MIAGDNYFFTIYHIEFLLYAGTEKFVPDVNPVDIVTQTIEK